MDTKKILKYDLFNNFSEEELAPLLKVMHNQSFEADETIISENDSGDSIMLLLDGTVSVSKALTMKMNQSLKREKEFTKLTASEKPFFGEISIFNDNKRTATIKAETNCEIGIFYNNDIINICNNNNEIGYKIMTNISKKLIDDLLITNEQVLKLTTAFSLIIDKHI